MDTVDSLNIEIQASTQEASRAIGDLCGKLNGLKQAIGGKTIGGLRSYAKEMGRVAASLKALNGVKTSVPKFGGLAGQLDKLSKVDFEGINDGAKALKEFSDAVVVLNGAAGAMKGFEVKGLNSLANSLKKMQGMDSQSVARGLAGISGELSKLSSINFDANGISGATRALGRLLSIDTGRFSASAFKKITRSIKSLGDMPDISNSVNRLVSSLARLANAGAKVGIAASQLPTLSSKLRRVVADMRSLGDISESINSFIGAIARLANAGEKADKTASALDKLGKELLQLFQTMQNAPELSEGTIRMTEALATLASSGQKAKSSSSVASKALEKLSEVFGKVAAAALKAAGAIAGMAKKLGGVATRGMLSATKGMLSATKGAFSKLSQVAAQTASSVAGSAKKIASSLSQISKSGNKINVVSLSLRSLAKAALAFGSVKSLLEFGESSIKLGSDITEVENVVDTAFGSMADQAYEFASTAKSQFGLSELAAKEYAGTMMAIFKSSGVAQAEAAKMSTTLAGLAGDIASFYNLDPDEAFYKLRAAISGETEPMKALGVNMNIVNLEAYAMSQGINKAYREMPLAEQAMLRYNYILAATGDAQGDFAKTANTYANQFRLLKLNIESIKAVIGQGLIAAILPAIKALNKFMEKLMQAAKVFRDFMYVLTGNKVTGSQKGFANDISDVVDYSQDLSGISDGMEDVEESTDGAADSAKKLKKALSVLPFDELNQLTAALEIPDSSSSAKPGKVPDLGLGDDGMFGSFDDFFDKPNVEPINKWAQAIREAFLKHDWEGLGHVIADMVNIGLQKLYDAITEITPKVEAALKAFAATFNSFVKWLDWELLGRTIGAGVNLITRSINALLGPGGIDFENLGRQMSKGFRGMVDEIEWRDLGNAIGNWLMVAWRIADGFIQDMWRIDPKTMLDGWAELGIALGTAVNGLFERINFPQIARVLTDGFRGVLRTLTFALNTIRFDDIARNINEGLQVFYDGVKWETMGAQIAEFSLAVANAFNQLLTIDFGLLGRIIGAMATDAIRAFNTLFGPEGLDLERLGKNIADGLRGIMTEVPWNEFGEALGNGFMAAWRILDGFISQMSQKSDAGLTGWKELGKAVANAVDGIFTTIDFPRIGAMLAKAFNGVFESLQAFVDTMEANGTWKQIADRISRGLNNAISGIKPVEAAKAVGDFVTGLLGTMLAVAEKTRWEDLGQKIAKFLIDIPWGTILGQVFSIITEVLGGLFTGFAGEILNNSEKIGSALSETLGIINDTIAKTDWKAFGSELTDGLNGLIDGIDWGEVGRFISEAAIAILDLLIGAIKKLDWKLLGDSIGDALAGVDWNGVSDKIFELLGVALEKLLELGGYIGLLIWRAFEGIEKYFQDKIEECGGNVVAGILKGILDALAGIGKWIVDHVFTPFINGFKEAFGINSPSTVMAEQGGFIIEGLLNGLKEKIGSVLDWFGQLPGWIKEKLGEAKEWLKEKGRNALEGLRNGWDAVKESKVGKAAAELGGYVKGKVGNALTWIKEKGSHALEGLRAGWDSVKESKVGKAATELGGYVKTKVGNATVWIKDKGKDAIGGLRAGWDEVKESKVGQAARLLGDYVKQRIGNANIWLYQKGQDIISGLKNGWDFGWRTFSAILGGIGVLIQNAMPNLFSIGQNLIMGFVRGFQSIHIPLPHIQIGWTQHMIGSLTFSTPNFGLNWYAKGGLFGSASVIGVGEAGSEAVLPLENKRTMKMIASAIISNMDIKTQDNPFIENIALATQRTAVMCEGAHESLLLISKAESTLNTAAAEIVSHAKDGVAALGELKTQINDAAQGAKDSLSKTKDDIVTTIKSADERIGSVGGQILDSIRTSAQDLTNSISTGVTSITSSISQAEQTLSNNISTGVTSITQAVSQSIQPLSNDISMSATNVVSSINQAAQTLSNNINTGVISITSSISQMTTSLPSSYNSVVSSGNMISGISANTLTSKVNTNTSQVPLNSSQVVQLMQRGLWQNPVSTGQPVYPDALKKKIQSINSYANYDIIVLEKKVTQHKLSREEADKQIAEIRLKANAEISKVKKQYGFASGGIVKAETLANIGEGNRREAILPLENRQAMKMVANAIVSSMAIGVKEDPFSENIALATQRTAVQCEMIHSALLVQGRRTDEGFAFVRKIAEYTNVIFGVLTGSVGPTVEGIPEIIKSGAKVLMDSMDLAVQAGIEKISQCFDSLSGVLTSEIRTISDGMAQGIDSVCKALDLVVSSLDSGLIELGTQISQAMLPVVNNLGSGFAQTGGVLGGSSIPMMQSPISGTVTTSKPKITSIPMQYGYDTRDITNRFYASKEDREKQIEEVEKRGQESIERAKETIRATVGPLNVNTVLKQDIKVLEDLIKADVDMLKKRYGLKTGGLVRSPIFAQMGEMSRPEAVLPLTDHRAMSMVAESIYSNAPAGGFDKDSLMDAIVEGVVTAMMNNQQNQQPVNVNCYATLKTENNEVLARAVAKGQSSLDYRMNPIPQF